MQLGYPTPPTGNREQEGCFARVPAARTKPGGAGLRIRLHPSAVPRVAIRCAWRLRGLAPVQREQMPCSFGSP